MIIDSVLYKAVSLSVSTSLRDEPKVDSDSEFQGDANAVQEAIEILQADIANKVPQAEMDRACAALMQAVNTLKTYLDSKGPITAANNPIAYAIQQELIKPQGFGGPSIADECAKLGKDGEAAAIAAFEDAGSKPILDDLHSAVWHADNAHADDHNYTVMGDIDAVLRAISDYENAPAAKKDDAAKALAQYLNKLETDLTTTTTPGGPPVKDGFLTYISTLLNGKTSAGTSLETLITNVISGSPASALADFEKALDGGGISDLASALQTAISKEKWS